MAHEHKQLHENATKSRMVAQDDSSETTGDSDLRYYISDSKNQPVDIFTMIRKNRGDPAYDACFKFFKLFNQALTCWTLAVPTQVTRSFIGAFEGP